MAASAISVLTAFGYVVSYRYLSAFYRGLGAAWAIDLYPPTQIIQISAPVAIFLIGFSFTVWNFYPQISKTPVTITQIFVITAIGALATCTHLAIEKYSTKYVSHIWIAAAIAGGIAALMITTKVVRHVFESRSKMEAATYLLLLVGYGFFHFAETAGARNARRALDGNGSPVREAHLASDKSAERYQLLAIVPYDRALLRLDRGTSIEYRVLPISDIIVNARAGD
jgi:phosphate/sulfate permease